MNENKPTTVGKIEQLTTNAAPVVPVEPIVRCATERDLPTRESWLNGWLRSGGGVLIGSGVHCAGCGDFCGTTIVVIDEDWIAPEKYPDWPFNKKDCPVCTERTLPEITVDELANLKVSKLRQALIKAKVKSNI